MQETERAEEVDKGEGDLSNAAESAVVQVMDLRRIISARERSLESLRSTMVTTKQFYEDRISEAAESLSSRNAEVSSPSSTGHTSFHPFSCFQHAELVASWLAPFALEERF